MNTVESTTLVGPYGREDECAKFVIDDLTYLYKLSDIALIGSDYTLSLWIKSETDGSISMGGKTFSVSTDWAQCAATFTAASSDIYLGFITTGTYYIYHAQLETGTKATDWTPSPEDVDQDIATAQSTADGAQTKANEAEARLVILEGSVLTQVTDENGNTTLTQTGSGWTFNMTSLETRVDDTSEDLVKLRKDHDETAGAVDNLQNEVDAIGEKTAYITIDKEGGKPYIELGTKDNDGNSNPFRVRITDTSIELHDGTTSPAYMINNPNDDTSYFYIEKGIIQQELKQGGFVWQARENGNLGLIWIGG